MAGASDRINSLIAQEFSLYVHRLFFPFFFSRWIAEVVRHDSGVAACKSLSGRLHAEILFLSALISRIVSDFRRLEVLFRRPAHVPVRVVAGRNNFTSSRRAAEHALPILNSDVELLIKVRRSLCKQLNSVQTSPSLNDFENQAEVLMMQHLESAWGSCKHGPVELWASQVKGLDFQALDKALQQRFESFFGCAVDHAMNMSQNFLQYKERGEDRWNFKGQGLSCKETSNVSDAISLANDEEYDDNEVSEVDSDGGGLSIHNQRLPLVLISSNENGHESKTNVSRTKNRRNLPAQIEMTMKARICTDHITAPEEHCWHVIFGLVNHDHCEVAVDSLSYWSLDDESEVSTIKWPKGGVVLKETPSFVCYSCQLRCMGSADSPRVAFSWQYRLTQKYPAALRGRSNEAMTERVHGSRSLELQATSVIQKKDTLTDSRCTDLASLDVHAASQTTPPQVSSYPFYKRLGNLLPWKDSHKKTKVSTT